jgi:arginyl-tRNA--protein-N-Asp/Glu arginylyltransferase
MADPAQIQAAAKSVMPMYQARLGGLQGSTMDAMRLNAQQDIQSQYGNALRAATQQAGSQGIRGPAAVAMQQDIRNQMGQAQAKYSRDLTVADWDAQRQALADYYGIYQQQAGTGIGTLSALQQLLIAQQAQQQQAGILRG